MDSFRVRVIAESNLGKLVDLRWSMAEKGAEPSP
jgi:hypothetical protein